MLHEGETVGRQDLTARDFGVTAEAPEVCAVRGAPEESGRTFFLWVDAKVRYPSG